MPKPSEIPLSCTETHQLRFMLPLPIPSKKNSRTAHLTQSRVTGKWRNYISNSESWKAYESKAIFSMKKQLRDQLDGGVRWEHYESPCIVTIFAWYANKRIADVANIFDGVSDLLQDSGVIANDRQIDTSLLSRVIADERSVEEQGGIEVTIAPSDMLCLNCTFDLK